MMQLVRDILYIMNVCEIFMILANLLYKCYNCLKMLANVIANLTNVLQMKLECKTWVSNLHFFTLLVFHFVLYLPGPVQLAYFPSNLDLLSTFPLQSVEMSIRMQGNLYKHLTISYNHYKCLDINKNGLPLLMNILLI